MHPYQLQINQNLLVCIRLSLNLFLRNFLLANPQKAKALHDYVSQAANQISLKAGQIINVAHLGGPGSWSKGEEIGTGIEITGKYEFKI